MTIYIACPYPERDYAIAVMHALEARGVTVTSRWLKAPDDLADEHARKDLADVDACDWLLALNPSAYHNAGTGGRHVELGYAIARGKRVMLVGERSNIFHYLSDLWWTTLTAPTEIAAIMVGVADADPASLPD